MVVVKKQSGDVKISVDLQALNNNVLCEVHPTPVTLALAVTPAG